MFTYQRLNNIFTHIYNQEFTSQKELATKFDVSMRTIRTDINELNEQLKDYGGQIILQRGKGYLIEGKEKLSIQMDKLNQASKENLETSQGRMNTLLTILLFGDDYISLDELSEILYVSRPTLLTYLRQLKEILLDYDLTIRSKANIGYKIHGREASIRQCIYQELINRKKKSYITTFLPSEQLLFQRIELSELMQCTLIHFPPNVFRITDFHRKNFAIDLAIVISRVMAGHLIDFSDQPAILVDIHLQLAVDALVTAIEENYLICLPASEKQWIISRLLAGLSGAHSTDAAQDNIRRLVDDFLLEIYRLFEIDLQMDSILEKDLVQHFLTYLPIKNLMTQKENPLLETIKKVYSFPFNICLLSMENLPGLQLTEDELGYVALHVAASLERKKKSILKKKKVLIVCGQGVSMSRLVETILHKEFDYELEILDSVSFALFKTQGPKSADFIVSTIPISKSEIPVVELDFLQLEKGIKQIKELARKTLKKDIPHHFFDQQLFYRGSQSFNRDRCLQELCHLLANQNIANPDFFDKVLERETLSSTVISEHIAIPHSISDEIDESKIAVFLSEKPIKWTRESSVNIVFLLAIAPKDKQRLQEFFEFLYKFLQDPDLEKTLIRANSFEEFLQAFAKVN